MNPQLKTFLTPGKRFTCTKVGLMTLALAATASGHSSVHETADSSDQAKKGHNTESSHTPSVSVNVPAVQTADEDGAIVTLDKKGLRIRSANGDASIKIGGRVQVDATAHSHDMRGGQEISDGTELRRGRIAISGTLAEDWLWTGEVDWGNNATSVKDFWMAVEGENKKRLYLGHQKQPYSLALEMSSNDLPFAERGIDNFLVVPFVDRAIGARVEVPTENTFFAAGLFGEGVSGSATEDEGYGAAARYVFAPVQEADETVHLGVRAAWRAPSSDNVIDIKDETTNQSNFSIVNTGDITDVDQTILYGVEGAWAKGPFSITGEFNQADIGRDGTDLNFSSWHVATTWSLTGESRADAYNIASGEFKRLKQATTSANPFEGGAWELAARYATIDVQDEFVNGGEQDAVTLGINWQANTNVRFLLNWSRVIDTTGGDAATSASEDLDIFTLRAQLTF